jgi:RNA polymerase sigma factor (sigma-70 family)
MSLNSRELLDLYNASHHEAANAIFDRYVIRLIALVRSRIGRRLGRRIDAEDVVQSAYRSFFVHAKNNEYQLAHAGDLWGLLARITLNKLYGQIEKHTAAKRSIANEEQADAISASAEAPEPSPAEVVAIVEELHLIVKDLPPPQQQVLTSYLQGQSITEISHSVGKAERTVRRMLSSAKGSIEKRLLRHDGKKSRIRSKAVDPEAPLRYSNYVLEKLLGSGGMGKVFRAREVGTGRTVAIKALHKFRQRDERAVSQFVQEFQILEKLRHANIVGVQGLGRFPSGGYFIVMDFVDAIDLQKLLERGPVSLERASAIVLQVVRAIEHAHRNGIVHCDLKPANVLLDKDDRVTVTDFGFAFLTAGLSRLSSSLIGGSMGYIAPEVLGGDSEPTPAADIYAIGVLLWVLTVGALPIDFAAIEGKGKEFAAIAAVVRRCLADDPYGRFQTALDLRKAINGAR